MQILQLKEKLLQKETLHAAADHALHKKIGLLQQELQQEKIHADEAAALNNQLLQIKEELQNKIDLLQQELQQEKIHADEAASLKIQLIHLKDQLKQREAIHAEANQALRNKIKSLEVDLQQEKYHADEAAALKIQLMQFKEELLQKDASCAEAAKARQEEITRAKASKDKIELLEQELQRGKHHADEAAALKIQLMHLKDEIQQRETMYAEATKALSFEKQQKETLLQKELDLNTLLGSYRQKTTEMEKQQLLLSSQVHTLEETLRNAQKDLQSTTEHVTTLDGTLHTERVRIKELVEEEESLKIQLDHLKNRLLELQQLNHQTTSENEHLKISAEEERSTLLTAQNEVNLLKQMMMKTIQEFKEDQLKTEEATKQQLSAIQLELEHKVSEKNTLNQLLKDGNDLNTHLKQEMEKIQKQFNELSDTSAAQTIAHRELSQFTEELKIKLAQVEEQKKSTLDSLNKKEALISDCKPK